MAKAIGLALLFALTAVGSALNSEPGDSDFVPGFQDPRHSWKDIARIELIEGEDSYKKLGQAPTPVPVSDVILFRYRDNRRRPLARGPDPFSPSRNEIADPATRLKMRGEKWRALIEKHNPTIHLDAIHLDVATAETLFSGIRSREKVNEQQVLHQPETTAVEAAQQDEIDAVNSKLIEHQTNKHRATFLYYAVNALLGCGTIAVLAFLILPALRRDRPAATVPPSGDPLP